MRLPALLALTLFSTPAHAGEAADFIAALGPPGLPDAVAQYVRMHPSLRDVPAPLFRAIHYDRIASSENELKIVSHADGLTHVRLSLAAAAGEAEREFAVGLGGLLFLARTDAARVRGLSDRATWVAKINSVEGKLFPLAVGNQLTIDYVLREGWYFPGGTPNTAQRFGQWRVRETLEVADEARECPETGAAAVCDGFTVVQSCMADGQMFQDGRPISPPPLWFCQARAERRYSTGLGWSWHPAVGSPRTIDAIDR
ncbi:MAG: hypothetical protein GC202_09290 [Alphaproteobacteria bacterium]|nr:hypothetical protein [Alphaproteobacteria bacterium]